ncbi:hypothetical protein LWI29_036046 [Acer saccharum]|uniref:CCHC-type domain-containing protein n=1 Tax=Acer saccharum TaxID=4024 RepID=A0AA39RGQ4_ACESA|nr:hypothetical protein LWI29_036046 [Acer saccharum]
MLLRYERVLDFCYKCNRLGHTLGECSLPGDNWEVTTEANIRTVRGCGLQVLRKNTSMEMEDWSREEKASERVALVLLAQETPRRPKKIGECSLRVLRIGCFTCFTLAVLRCFVLKALRVLRIEGFTRAPYYIRGFTYVTLAMLRCSVSEALRVSHWLCFSALYQRLYVCSISKALHMLRIRGFMYFTLVVLQCSISEALHVLRIRGFMCAPYRRLDVFRTGCASVLRIEGFTCAPYRRLYMFSVSEDLRISHWLCFDAPYRRLYVCSVSEALHVSHWLCFDALYQRLYVFHTGCASMLRIGGFIILHVKFCEVMIFGYGCSIYWSIYYVIYFIINSCTGCALVFCFGVLCSIWRDFCNQGVVLCFRSLYAPCLERLLHSRCGAPLSESLFSVPIAGTLPL